MQGKFKPQNDHASASLGEYQMFHSTGIHERQLIRCGVKSSLIILNVFN